MELRLSRTVKLLGGFLVLLFSTTSTLVVISFLLLISHHLVNEALAFAVLVLISVLNSVLRVGAILTHPGALHHRSDNHQNHPALSHCLLSGCRAHQETLDPSSWSARHTRAPSLGTNEHTGMGCCAQAEQ